MSIAPWSNFYLDQAKRGGLHIHDFNQRLKKYNGWLIRDASDNNRRVDYYIDFHTEEDVVRFVLEWS